ELAPHIPCRGVDEYVAVSAAAGRAAHRPCWPHACIVVGHYPNQGGLCQHAEAWIGDRQPERCRLLCNLIAELAARPSDVESRSFRNTGRPRRRSLDRDACAAEV